MKLPAPEAELAGCVWLPRIVGKARALKAGLLPEVYAVRFGASDGVDGLFLRFFSLTREQIVDVAPRPDEAVAEWFQNLPAAPPSRIEEWNHIACNLGRPGFPMADRLPLALATKYRNVAHLKPETMFEVLNADERE